MHLLFVFFFKTLTVMIAVGYLYFDLHNFFAYLTKNINKDDYVEMIVYLFISDCARLNLQ